MVQSSRPAVSCRNDGCYSACGDVTSRRYRYIIVGDGSAGAILARKLSDPDENCDDNSVLVLEKGVNRIQPPGYPQNQVVFDGNIADNLGTLTADPMYAQLTPCQINGSTTDPILSSDPTFYYSAGLGWGGGGSHFYMLHYKGTPKVWNEYAAEAGDSSWSYNELIPIWQALETYYPHVGGCFDSAIRGSSGPIEIIQVTPDDLINPSSPNCAPFAAVAATDSAVGVGYSCDYNSGMRPTIGISATQLYGTLPVKNGFGTYRSWSHNSFLPIGTVIDAYGRGIDGRDLTIKSNALGNRVLFKGNKAIGVEFLDLVDGQMKKVYGDEIILSAGAIGTPQILQRSGVGDPALLNSLNIPVVVPNGNVGSNMEGHTVTTVIMTDPLLNADSTPFEGFMSINSDLHDSTRSPSDPLYYPADGVRRAQILVMDGSVLGLPFPATFSDSFILDTNFQGTIKIASQDPTVEPNVDLRMYSDDTTGLVNGSTLNQQIALVFAIQKLATAAGKFIINIPPTAFASITAMADYLKATAGVAEHQVGTCRMGTSMANAVVDSDLNVFGTRRLKVADLSIYHRVTDGNPMMSAMTAALKCVQSLGVQVVPAL
jgi:choline dehydrogenase